jgi:alanyl aminopeptidase
MEHPGLVTYGPRWLLIRDGESVAAARGQIGIVAHELAHQWFGDLVTTAWWDDLWLNEAFATWMTPKAIAAVHPEMDGDIEPMLTRAAALASDSLASARQIRQPIAVDTDMRLAFDRITYSKGATVIRMFERWIGPDQFQKAARAYLTAHADRNATAADFLAALGQATSEKRVAAAFASFLDQPGVPEIAMELRCPAGGPAVLGLSQRRWVPAGAGPVSGEPRWHVPVCVAVPDGKRRKTHCTLLDQATGELALGAKCPAWLLPNADGAGYYLGVLGAEPLAALLERGWARLSQGERLALVGDLEILTDGGQGDVGALIARLPRLGASGDPYLVEVAVGRLEKLAKLAPAEQQASFARLVRATVGAAGRRIGWTARRGDKAGEARVRGRLLTLLAVDGRDAAARGRAIAMARAWMADHKKVPESMWAPVLETAVRVSPTELGPALIAAVRGEEDRIAQRAIYQALALVPDAALQRQVLELVLAADPIPPELVQALSFPADLERQVTWWQFVRDHLGELLRRLPEDYQGVLANAPCDPAQRDEVAAFLTEKIAPLPTVGRMTVTQRIEAMDQCIARRAVQAPALASSLAAKK